MYLCLAEASDVGLPNYHPWAAFEASDGGTCGRPEEVVHGTLAVQALVGPKKRKMREHDSSLPAEDSTHLSLLV